ncbi:MAG: DUF3021 family protein [Brevinema sp.]
MRIEEVIKSIVRSFCVITTGVTASMYIFCLVFNPTVNFTLTDIGRVLFMAIVSDLTLFIFYAPKEISKIQMLIRQITHLITLLCVLLFLAVRWDWVDIKNPVQCLILLLLISIVYVAVLLVNTYNDKKVADKLNEIIKNRYTS